MWLFSLGRQSRSSMLGAAAAATFVMVLASRKLSRPASLGVAGLSALFLLARLHVAAFLQPFLAMAWLHQDAPSARLAAFFVSTLSLLAAAATSTHFVVHH